MDNNSSHAVGQLRVNTVRVTRCIDYTKQLTNSRWILTLTPMSHRVRYGTVRYGQSYRLLTPVASSRQVLTVDPNHALGISGSRSCTYYVMTQDTTWDICILHQDIPCILRQDTTWDICVLRQDITWISVYYIRILPVYYVRILPGISGSRSHHALFQDC